MEVHVYRSIWRNPDKKAKFCFVIWQNLTDKRYRASFWLSERGHITNKNEIVHKGPIGDLILTLWELHIDMLYAD